MPNLRRVKYDCVRCYGFRTKTADDMITHFRIKHGIKPETFSAKKRKEFYDYFKLADDEYTRDTDEEREYPDYNGEEMDTTILEGDHDPCTFSPSADVTESTDISGNLDQVSIDIQIPDEGTGPYFCPYCGKGVGYFYPELKKHFSRYNKSCKRRKYHTCQDCKTGYSESRFLIYHRNEFGGKCAEIQKQREEERQQKKRERKTKSLQEDNHPLSPSVEVTDSTTEIAGNIEIPEEGTGPYFCPYCGMGVGYYFPALKIHFVKYNKCCKRLKKYYSCEICKVDFAKPEPLIVHKRYIRGKCAKIQKRRQKYREMHSRTYQAYHEPDKFSPSVEVTYSTPEITGNIDEKILLTDIKIPEEGTGPYFCPYCGKGVGYFYPALTRHFSIYKKSCERKQFYSCNVCETSFPESRNLLYHKQDYAGKCAEIQKQRQEEREQKKREKKKYSLQKDHDHFNISPSLEVSESTHEITGNFDEDTLYRDFNGEYAEIQKQKIS